MCWSCGCARPADSHQDSRNLVTLDLQGAADAANTTIPQVISNMVRTLALYRGRTAGGALKEAEVMTKVMAVEPERQFTLGLAYPVNRADVAKARDGFRDFVAPEVLEEAAWNYLRKGASVGLLHAKGTDGAGTVVESYIYRGPDWHLKAVDGSEQVIVAGDWLLGTVWDTPAWAAIKRQQLRGYSPQGPVRRRIPSAEALAGLRS